MKSHPDYLAARAGGLAGFLAMAVIGWNFTGGPAETISENLAPPVTRSYRPRPSRPPGIRDVTAAKMAVIRNAGDSAERMRATIELANGLPLSEFGKWLDGGWFELREGAELTLFTHILRERWWREDPEGFVLRSIQKSEYGDTSTLLAVWIEKDPQRVIDFFKRHPDINAEFDALADLAGTHPDLALQRLLEMNDAGLGEDIYYYGDTLIRKLAEKSPAALESSLDSLKESVRKKADKFLVLEKFKTDYAGELRKLWARPDGFEVYDDAVSNKEGLSGRILEDLANLPPDWRTSIADKAWKFIDAESAEKWWNADLAGAGFSELEAYKLQTTALAEMASANPEVALQRMAGLKIQKIEEEGGFDNGDPSGDGRWAIIKNALMAHPEKTAALVALLATEQDRGISLDILEGMPDELAFKAATNIETPEQWLVKTSAAGLKQSYEYGSMLRSWDSAKLAELGERFRSLPDDQKQRVALVITSSSDDVGFSNRSLSGEAIRYLLTHPADSADKQIPWLKAASTYAGNLAATEPETARDWVQSLPEGEPKLWAQLNVHSIWSQYDPKAADQWFKSLPAKVQAEILKNTKKEK